MKRSFNLFHFVLVLLTVVAFYILSNHKQETLSFYGFAESNQTEINYNHPVVVDHINVNPGQEVKAGETLMLISRIKSKEVMADQEFKIAELQAESRAAKQKASDRLAQLDQSRLSKLAVLDDQITALQKEMEFKKSLVAGLKTVNAEQVDYSPILSEISELQQRKVNVDKESVLARQGLENEQRESTQPYSQQINRLKAEQSFELAQERQEIIVTAPSDGLIGNIYCKEAEHIPSYKTLVSFYEPHSGIIKGYVHEDLTLQVPLRAMFYVKSIKDGSKVYDGKVIGLGSRIVEIPARLRKMPEIKTFGREVLIEIDKNNSFLQKEKVAIVHVNNN